MYYLKYRPQQIGQIDNQERQETLFKIFAQSTIPHAFLFTGPKGTGKTSTARIIAKILNCEKVKLGQKAKIEPCNKCQNCLAINQNRFLDVIELDAASSRGIEDIRALRETVAYTPALGGYKIYIIDEVHMLTKEAFNALLKTLEEPPSQVVFILATTEPHKLPETIVSRCLTIAFHKATDEELVNSLKRIVQGENLKVTNEVLFAIAQKSQGSFRDGAKYLEMASTTTDLSLAEVKAMLQNNAVINPTMFLELILSQQVDKALEELKNQENLSLDYLWLIEALLQQLKDLLLTKKGLVKNKQLQPLVSLQSLSALSRLMKLLLEAYSLTKQSPIPSLPLMISIVEFKGGNE